MDKMLIALTTVVIILLLHFAIVDFRFRVAGGMGGIWRHNPAPPELWFVRLSLLPPILAALSIVAFGPKDVLWIIIAVLMVVHIASLLILKAFPVE